MTTESSSSTTGATDPNPSYRVEVTTQDKFYLKIPALHFDSLEVEVGDRVGIKPVNVNGQFGIIIDKDSSIGVSRKVREERYSDTVHQLTLPRRVARAARLGGDPVQYQSDGERILALLDHQPQIAGEMQVHNVTNELMTTWSRGIYAYQIPTKIHDGLSIGDSLWFWYDVFAGGFIFVLETNEEAAPDGAIELSVQHTEDASSDYMVNLPKQICEALEINGQYMKWGDDSLRILGLYQ